MEKVTVRITLPRSLPIQHSSMPGRAGDSPSTIDVTITAKNKEAALKKAQESLRFAVVE